MYSRQPKNPQKKNCPKPLQKKLKWPHNFARGVVLARKMELKSRSIFFLMKHVGKNSIHPKGSTYRICSIIYLHRKPIHLSHVGKYSIPMEDLGMDPMGPERWLIGQLPSSQSQCECRVGTIFCLTINASMTFLNRKKRRADSMLSKKLCSRVNQKKLLHR